MKSMNQWAGLLLFGAWVTSSAVAAPGGGFHGGGGGFHGGGMGFHGGGRYYGGHYGGFRGGRYYGGRYGYYGGRYYRGHYYRGRYYYGAGFGFYDPWWWGWGWGYPYDWGYPYYPYYPDYDDQAAAAHQGQPAANATVAVQSELARQGYYDGSLDGVIGSGTRRAIREYQRDHGLPVTGEITPELLASMKLRQRE